MSDLNYELRKANMRDINFIYELANDPEVRKNSFNSKSISFTEHEKWFEHAIQDDSLLFYVLFSNDTPVGQIRVKIKDGKGLISYSVAKPYRGKGYGGKMLNKIEEIVKKERTDIDELVAEVKIENTISRKKFQTQQYKEIELARYTKRINR